MTTFQVSEPIVEMTHLEHKSFSGISSSVSSEMFSPSEDFIKSRGNNNSRSMSRLVGSLFSGEDDQNEIQLPSLRTMDEIFPSAGFGFDSLKSPSKLSIRKSERVSKIDIGGEISRSVSYQGHCSDETHSVAPPVQSVSPETLNSMDESQLRESLHKSLLENSILVEEVEIKDKTIRRLSECLNDVQVFSQSRRHITENVSHSHFQNFSMAEENSASGDNFSSSRGLLSGCTLNEVKFNLENLCLTNQLCVYSSENIDEDNVVAMKTQCSNTSLFEEISIAIRESRPALEKNVITGTYIAKDVLLGGSVGWLSAYLLKKFGTTALTAVTGGVIVIHLAARKGYVIVNWGEIYKEIEKQSEENDQIKNEMEWICDKVHDLKFWIQQHKYVASGLAVSFIYNIFK